MSLTAYVRYDNTGRIVPGGPIVTSIKPKVGDWVKVDDVLVTTIPSNYKLRAFIRYINKFSRQSNSNKYVAGSLILQHNEPQDGNWKEVYFINPACCPVSTTTTTTTTATPTTTTTTSSSTSTTTSTTSSTSTTTSTTTTAGPVVNSVKMLTTEYINTAAVYLADFNQQYYLLNGANGFTLYYTGTLGAGTTLYFNSNLTDPAGVFSPFYLIETLATQGNPYAQPTDRIFTIDSNGTLTAQVSTIAQSSYTQWQIDKRSGNVNGLCSDLNPSGFVAAPGTFTYDVGTQIYSAGYSSGVWNTFLDAYMSDGTYRYTTNGSGLLVSKELCSSITTTTTTTTTGTPTTTTTTSSTSTSTTTSTSTSTTTTTTTLAPGDDFIVTENNDPLITEDDNNLIMNYPLPTSEIITEAGDFVITEDGNNLTTQ